MDIGIIGYGFVGKAVHYGLHHKLQDDDIRFRVYDPFVNVRKALEWQEKPQLLSEVRKLHSTFDDIHEFHSCDFIFVCLPTPTDFTTGKQDISAFHEVLGTLNGIDPINAIIVIKSTVKPGTTQMFSERYTNLHFVFNPEFLTEANYLGDVINQDRIVLGGPTSFCMALENLYKRGWPEAQYFKMWYEESELVKYAANALLSIKVAFFNEIHQLALTDSLEYGKIVEAVASDPRLGPWGAIVPGPDGQLGFGGKCFPKDIVTLIRHFEDRVGCDPEVIGGAWKTNLSVREKQDWKEIKGATTENLHG